MWKTQSCLISFVGHIWTKHTLMTWTSDFRPMLDRRSSDRSLLIPVISSLWRRHRHLQQPSGKKKVFCDTICLVIFLNQFWTLFFSDYRRIVIGLHLKAGSGFVCDKPTWRTATVCMCSVCSCVTNPSQPRTIRSTQLLKSMWPQKEL